MCVLAVNAATIKGGERNAIGKHRNSLISSARIICVGHDQDHIKCVRRGLMERIIAR